MTRLVSLWGRPVSLVEALVLSASSWDEREEISQWERSATNDARRTPSKKLIDELDGLEALLTRRVLARLSSGECWCIGLVASNRSIVVRAFGPDVTMCPHAWLLRANRMR
jgi:hypothetical protein